MSKWIPVSESPPPLKERIVVTDGKDAIICTLETYGNTPSIHPEGVGGWEMEVDFEYRDITHWMPAPELP